MNLLGELPNGQLLESGIYPGLQGDAAPFWKDGENVLFRDGGVEQNYGLTGLANLASRPTGMKAVVASTEQRLFVGAGTKPYRYRNSDGLTELATMASSGGIYQFVPLQDACLISNGVDPLKLWDGSATPAPDITAPFTRANVIFKYKSQAFAAGTNNGGQKVEYSQVNSFSDWVPTLTNTASWLYLYELDGDIVCAKPLGTGYGIYSRSNAVFFYWVGGTITYTANPPLKGVGALSPYSVVSIGNVHFGITAEYCFATDLTSFTIIDRPHIRAWIDANVDWDRQTEIYGWPDWNAGMIRWCVPLLTGGTIGLGYNWRTGAWTKFNDGGVIGEESGSFPYGFVGKSSRLLKVDRSLYTNDASAPTAYVQTKPLDFGNQKKYKKIYGLSLDVTWTGTPQVTIGWSNDPLDSPTWLTSVDLAKEIFPDFLSSMSDVVFMHLKISSSGASDSWKLSGGKIYGVMTGNVN